jgi:hypothetical protein
VRNHQGDKINERLRAIVSQDTEPRGVKVEMVERRDLEIPQVHSPAEL